MTAPLPTPRPVLLAGMFDALMRLYIRLAPAYIADRERALTAATRLNRELTEAARTARNFADTERSGYIDRSFLEGP